MAAVANLPLSPESLDMRALWFLDTLTFIKASASDTRGAFAVCEQVLPPRYETPYHLHREEDEAFYILEGELTLILNGQRRSLRPGDFLFAPRNVAHGLRVAGPDRVRILIVVTPPGFENFVAEMSEPAKSMTFPPPQPPDMEKLVHLAAKYGIEILGPLPL